MSNVKHGQYEHLEDTDAGLAHETHILHTPTPLVRRWREWEVPEQVIRRALQQRAYASENRAKEQYVELEGFAYPMPRLPLVQKEAWGVAKSIDYEGTIYVRETERRDRTDEHYRYTYQRPRIVMETRTYNMMEEIATMLNIAVVIIHPFDIRLGRRVISYRVEVSGARAVRVAYITQQYLKHPEKKRRANAILQIYTDRPAIKL